MCICVCVCVLGGGRRLLIDCLLKLLMKSGQPALQLAVRGPSGDEKRTAAQEREGETREEEERRREEKGELREE